MTPGLCCGGMIVESSDAGLCTEDSLLRLSSGIRVLSPSNDLSGPGRRLQCGNRDDI